MEPSVPFHTLVKLVHAEGTTKENIRTFDLRLEIDYLISKLESQKVSSETYDPNPEIMFTQTTDPNKLTSISKMM